MAEHNDIQNLDDIKLLVDTFYEKVQKDNLIGPVFNENFHCQWSFDRS